MSYTSNYVLINDGCEHCRYTSHAFTLLNIPLSTIDPDQTVAKKDLITDSRCVITCNKPASAEFEALLNLTSSQHKSLIISLDHNGQINHERSKIIFPIRCPFTQHELLTALSLCTDDQYFDHLTADITNSLFEKLVGKSKKIRDLKEMVLKVANTDSTVLILGQSGTGKDVIASCIHQLSPRNENPFVPINCGAIPSELMESELFGHEKGAFTGALTRRPGRFELANSGTLFLDEIGDMPMPMQVKLLRVIQDRKIDRVGGNNSIPIDVRLIAATNKNLQDLIETKLFREDLFYRLNVFPIYVPSLHERAEDIPAIIEYLQTKIQRRVHHRVTFTESAMELLCNYPWPGNIRELDNFLERMIILNPDSVINVKDIDDHYVTTRPTLPDTLHAMPENQPFSIKEYISNVEQYLIERALERSNGIISLAAEYLSLGKNTLTDKIKKYNLAK